MVLDVAGGVVVVMVAVATGVGILQASQSGRNSRKTCCSHFMVVAPLPPAMPLHDVVVASNH